MKPETLSVCPTNSPMTSSKTRLQVRVLPKIWGRIILLLDERDLTYPVVQQKYPGTPIRNPKFWFWLCHKTSAHSLYLLEPRSFQP